MACLAITVFRLPPSYSRTSSQLIVARSRSVYMVLESRFPPWPSVQMFGRKGRTTVATISVECFIMVLFVIVGVRAALYERRCG